MGLLRWRRPPDTLTCHFCTHPSNQPAPPRSRRPFAWLCQTCHNWNGWDSVRPLFSPSLSPSLSPFADLSVCLVRLR